MPCNLAVTITKAVVSADHLLRLLTTSAVDPVVQAYLQDRFVGHCVTASSQGIGLVIWVAGYTISIAEGKVTVTALSAADASQLAEELTMLLNLLADELFAAQLGTLLSEFGATAQQVVVDNAGTAQMAYQFTLEL